MPHKISKSDSYKCFVCEQLFQKTEIEYHAQVHLPLCKSCKGSDSEKKKAAELLSELADGFVCGCI
ncbi:MAG: hypothetical protein N4A71_07875 [Carboxylicivirga sp.]|jgi:hypothetical protein|nr:hypothetical protein [Carboxylicivirga sp.]MCT4645065.1 hypothetical protein [Carboxylicivirga sp.]